MKITDLPRVQALEAERSKLKHDIKITESEVPWFARAVTDGGNGRTVAEIRIDGLLVRPIFQARLAEVELELKELAVDLEDAEP